MFSSFFFFSFTLSAPHIPYETIVQRRSNEQLGAGFEKRSRIREYRYSLTEVLSVFIFLAADRKVWSTVKWRLKPLPKRVLECVFVCMGCLSWLFLFCTKVCTASHGGCWSATGYRRNGVDNERAQRGLCLCHWRPAAIGDGCWVHCCRVKLILS